MYYSMVQDQRGAVSLDMRMSNAVHTVHEMHEIPFRMYSYEYVLLTSYKPKYVDAAERSG